MPKNKSSKTVYVCDECGNEYSTWSGQCLFCKSWGSLKERNLDVSEISKLSATVESAEIFSIDKLESAKNVTRDSTGFYEVDRVLGGGIVKGEMILISGEPGIGKSTLLLQIAKKVLYSGDFSILYVSGEESVDQLMTRYGRVKVDKSDSSDRKNKVLDDRDTGLKLKGKESFPEKNFWITEENNIDRVIKVVDEKRPNLVIIDSIQSVFSEDSSSFPGSISQVRECGIKLMRCAKKLGIPFFIVGQVTKDGVVAGPKVLEHMVDAVLYFEGDDLGEYRVLRSIKNRFGSTNEIGIFEMTSFGLLEVDDTANIFVSDSDGGTAGVVKAAIYKGSRVIFIEIQALTISSSFNLPRRLPTGFKKSRLEMLCAVLGRRMGLDLSGDDVFVNVSGGINVTDPAIDVAVCAAIISAKKNIIINFNKVFVGEVSLSGNIKKVMHIKNIQSEVKRRGYHYEGWLESGKNKIKDVLKF
ncbi:DNA repair protein RadA [Candidatus Dojkabacteria bacterium]|nr:DNA repair protein RadA [Candidatus Dojkabacteria bacterium]